MSTGKEQLWWEMQKNDQWKKLVAPFLNNPKNHQRVNNFIKIFYWRFRELKGIPREAYPEIDFRGFAGFEDDQKRAGVTTTEPIASWNAPTVYFITIKVNQNYLLTKLGMDKLITNYDNHGVNSVNCSFDSLIHTIAHELAHAYQNTVNDFPHDVPRSDCASSGDKITNSEGKEVYVNPELVTEHTQLTSEIEKLITSSPEYQKFKEQWFSTKSNRENNYDLPNQGEEDPFVRAEEEFLRLYSLIGNSSDLTDLNQKYQMAKFSPSYNLNKKQLDNLYEATKKYFIDKQNLVASQRRDNLVLTLMSAAIVILAVTLLIMILWGGDNRKKEKKLS